MLDVGCWGFSGRIWDVGRWKLKRVGSLQDVGNGGMFMGFFLAPKCDDWWLFCSCEYDKWTYLYEALLGFKTE